MKELEASQREMEGRLKELQDAVTADGEKLRNQASGGHNVNDIDGGGPPQEAPSSQLLSSMPLVLIS